MSTDTGTPRAPLPDALVDRHERVLGRIAESSGNFIAAVDTAWRFVAANRAFREEWPRVFGTEVALGASVLELLAHLPGQRDAVAAFVAHALAGNAGTIVLPLGQPGAPERMFEVRYQPLSDEADAVVGAWVSARDVTEDVAARREVERLTHELEARVQARTRELLDSEKRRRLAVSAAGVGDWELDPRTETLYLSSRSRELLGAPDGAAIALPLALEHIHPDDRARVAAAVQAARDPAGAGLYQVEFRVPRDDGRECWLEAHGRAEFTGAFGERQAARLRGVLLDVSERRRRERERLHMDQVLERITDAFWAVDAEWRFTHVNRRAEELWGRDRDGLLGRTLIEAFPALRDSAAHEHSLHTMRTREPSHFETVSSVLHRWIAASVYPAVDGGIFVFFRDIDERKTAEREREALLAREHAARMEAQQASSAKSEFLAVMSHELRTPLNAIAGYAELLEMGIHGPVSDAQRDALQRIQRAERHLLALIDEVMNLARIERQAMSYTMRDALVADLLAAADALVAPQMQARGLSLATTYPDAALHVHVDAEKLCQVLVNLLGNAVKFTPPGGQVELWCDEAGAMVRLHVRDTGCGIPPARLEHVFEPFVQVDARLTRTEEGMGLGLAISRELAGGMGGDVSVVSEVGVGSTFTVTVPKGSDA